MSGPKCADYEVVRNQQIEARARDQAMVRARELRARHEAVLADVQSLRSRYLGQQIEVPVTVPAPVPEDASSAAIEAYCRALSEAVLAATRGLRAASARAETAAFLARAVEGLSGGARRVEPATTVSTDLVSPAPPMTSSSGQSTPAGLRLQDLETHHTREARVQQVVASLVEEVSPSSRKEISNLAEQLRAERDPLRVDLLFSELKFRVQTANDAARKMLVGIEESERFLAQLRGLEGPDVSAVCEVLDRVTRGEIPFTDDLRRRVPEVYARARREADRQYTADMLRRAFLDLGYEVGEDFTTLFVNRGVVYCEKPAWRDYSICVQANSDRGRLDFNVLRFAEAGQAATPASQVRDREIEESWCADYDRVVASLQHEGIRCDTVRRSPPGAVPVPVVLRSDTSRNRRAPARQRERRVEE